MDRHVVLTGGTRGIGFGLVKAFLNLGCSVTFSGTNPETIAAAIEELRSLDIPQNYAAAICNIAKVHDITDLYDFAVRSFGPVTIWINNAGINQPDKKIVQCTSRELREVLTINLFGFLETCRLIQPLMDAQGYGAIYGMEGFGSDGRIMDKKSLYGVSKLSIPYIVRSFSQEITGSPVIIGSLNPGMVHTELLIEDLRRDPERTKNNLLMLNLLSDPADTVSTYLARRVLTNTIPGMRIRWLTRGRVLARILLLPIKRRHDLEKIL
jgi:NAD(P)-dependent dehydrogenase (short-subunit alcohol dehydrogenase family)